MSLGSIHNNSIRTFDGLNFEPYDLGMREFAELPVSKEKVGLWRSFLGYVCTSATDLGSDVGWNVLRAFHFVVGSNIVLSSLKWQWIYGWPAALGFVILALVFYGGWWKKQYFIATLGLLTFRIAATVYKYPYPNNHYYFEDAVLILLLFVPYHQEGRDPKLNWPHLFSRTLLYAFMSVFFYSAVQKVLHGEWLNGEFFTSCLFYTSLDLCHWTQQLATMVSSVTGAPLHFPLPYSSGTELVPFQLSFPVELTILLTSWMVLLSEAGIPILMLLRKTRKVGFFLAIFAAAMIGLTSKEYEFMTDNLTFVSLGIPYGGIRKFYFILGVRIVMVIWSILFFSKPDWIW
jgi:hypothetical protein